MNDIIIPSYLLCHLLDLFLKLDLNSYDLMLLLSESKDYESERVWKVPGAKQFIWLFPPCPLCYCDKGQTAGYSFKVEQKKNFLSQF